MLSLNQEQTIDQMFIIPNEQFPSVHLTIVRLKDRKNNDTSQVVFDLEGMGTR